jgi:hypothetical protein
MKTAMAAMPIMGRSGTLCCGFTGDAEPSQPARRLQPAERREIYGDPPAVREKVAREAGRMGCGPGRTAAWREAPFRHQDHRRPQRPPARLLVVFVFVVVLL